MAPLRTDNIMTDRPDVPLGPPPRAKFSSGSLVTSFREIPLVDLALADSDPAAFFAQLQYATADVGFMLLKNAPGLDEAFQSDVFRVSHAFFDLPEDVKLRTDIRQDRHLRGSSRQDKVKDLRLNINLHAYHFAEELPEVTDPDAPLWKRVLHGPNRWPDPELIPDFRPVITEYMDRCEALGRRLCRLICRMLGAPESYATRYFEDVEDPTDLARFCTLNHYPPIQEIPEERRKELEEGYVRGIQAHRDDFNAVTMLIQDETGLEVLSHDGVWVDVPVIPGTVVVNLGLVLSELTRGALQATVHRVNSLKVRKRRISAPYFLTMAPDVPLLPIPHSLPSRPAVVDPAVALANAIQDRSLRFVHRRLAILYKSAETFWPREWNLLNELLAASQQVYMLQAKLQPSLATSARTDTEDWKARL
ncbi:hypothetical protein DFJ74DRAFT_682397 [Hyaloraphidium curvatum]|nr:hypothetical protein DFJ74DRAFT_682397 [Hyaloraphidium curvatum]